MEGEQEGRNPEIPQPKGKGRARRLMAWALPPVSVLHYIFLVQCVVRCPRSWVQIQARAFLCGACQFSHCPSGVIVGTPVSSHSPNTCTGESKSPVDTSVWMNGVCVCALWRIDNLSGVFFPCLSKPQNNVCWGRLQHHPRPWPGLR